MKKVIIMGAGGRDFHNFNMVFKDNPNNKVVAFTAAQIPNISNRRYPKELAGKFYPYGIPIYPEDSLGSLIEKHNVDEVVLSYSDLPYFHVMHKVSLVNSLGANFRFLGPDETMLKSIKPVIAITAVRTGCGKSQTTRRVSEILKERGKRVVVVRHPMPYGDLRKQVLQRFKTYKDLDKHNCTIEEREEYEPHIDIGNIVYAGVDYKKILTSAEREADIIIWDGGNNDFPFFKPDLHIVITDPHRPKHEITYYPGEINLRMADVAIINKVKTAKKRNIEIVRNNIKKYNPSVLIIDAESAILVNKPEIIEGKKVVVVEDGPTLTHGDMKYGAGFIAADKYKAKIINPKPFAVGSIKEIFNKYKKIGPVIPAMGYGERQIKELEQTINRTKCESVISATPIDLRRVIKINKPIARIGYELKEVGKPNLNEIISRFLRKKF